MPGLRAEGPALKSRALAWTASAAAGAALVSFAGLIGRWSANPALGWGLALAAAGLGRAAASSAAAADEEGARAWAAAGALAVLAVPALLRVIGLSSAADPALLRDPLAGGFDAAFTLGQAALLAAFAAGAWSRASRDAGKGGAAAALAGGAAAAGGVFFAEPTIFLAAAALAVLAAAVRLERPWARLESSPLRARLFAAGAVLGLGLGACAPRLLLDVWMARLQSAYPGGGYLALADDGNRLWGAYRFSGGAATMLRDGVPQIADPTTAQLAALALFAQRDQRNLLLVVRPPDALVALAAQELGAVATIADSSRAERKILDTLGGGPEWRAKLKTPEKGASPNLALVFLPSPLGAASLRLADEKSLKKLRASLGDGAAVGILLPSGAAAREVDAIARAAAAVFGRARIADLPKGVLVLGARAEIVTDPAQLDALLTDITLKPRPPVAKVLTEKVHWRPLPSAN